MMRSVRWEIVHHIFRLDPRKFDQHAIEVRRERELAQLQMAAATDPVNPDSNSDDTGLSREQRRRLKKRRR